MKVLHITPYDKYTNKPMQFTLELINNNRLFGEHEVIAFNFNKFFESMFTMIKKRGHTDIIHCHYGSFLSIMTILIFGRNKLIVHYRGSDLNGLKMKTLKAKIRGIFSVFSSYYCKNRIFVSNNLRKLVRSKKNDIILPTFVNTMFYNEMSKAKAKEILQFDYNKVYLFYSVGKANTNNKRLDIFNNVINDLKVHYSKEIIAVVAHGQIRRDQMPLYLKACDCTLIFSDFEGSPNIVRESIVCDTPVVGFNVGDLGDYNCNCGVYLTDKNIVSIRNKLMYVLEKYGINKKINENWKNKYTMASYINTLNSYYRSIY